jgi:parallel beta-helix repeat protein
MLIGNNASNNRKGIVLVESNINTLSGNNVSYNEYGILLSSSDFNVLKNNHVSNNNFGISLVYYSNDNLLYNNFLNNINNFNNIYNNVINNLANTWNTSKNKTTNIISGPYLGGNFWTSPNGTGFSQTCTDNDKDGICDLPYSLFDNNIDYLPLAYHISDFTPPESITNLMNITHARTYINFIWLNPPDPDFSHVMLYLNGTFKNNITAPQNYYNFTGL